MKLIASILCVALVVGATGVAQAVTSTVTINDFYFLPKNDTIPVGGTIEWRNDGDATHTTTRSTGADPWDSGFVGPLGTFSRPFNTPGTYAYHCNVHPTLMSGTIVVIQGATPSKANTWSGLRKAYRKTGKVRTHNTRKL